MSLHLIFICVKVAKFEVDTFRNASSKTNPSVLNGPVSFVFNLRGHLKETAHTTTAWESSR